MEDRFAPGGAERGELTGEVLGVDRDAGIAENRARILHQKFASKKSNSINILVLMHISLSSLSHHHFYTVRFGDGEHANYPVAVLHEISQEVEGPRFEVYDLAAVPQFAAPDVQPMIAKRQNHFCLPEASRPAALAENHKPAVRKKKTGRKAFNLTAWY